MSKHMDFRELEMEFEFLDFWISGNILVNRATVDPLVSKQSDF